MDTSGKMREPAEAPQMSNKDSIAAPERIQRRTHGSVAERRTTTEVRRNGIDRLMR